MGRLPIFLAAFGAVAFGQGTRPKGSPAEYPARAELKGITLAAENLGHSLSTEYGAYFLRDYVVIDIAVFSTDKKPLNFSAGNFSLRVNGKRILLAQAPGLIAASLKYDEWSEHPRAMASAGVGDTGVILGAPQRTPRFPDDPNGRSRVPNPPSVDTSNENVPQRQDMLVEQVIERISLPEGSRLAAPFSGFVYFPLKGKMSKLKSLELLYQGDYGEAALRLL